MIVKKEYQTTIVNILHLRHWKALRFGRFILNLKHMFQVSHLFKVLIEKERHGGIDISENYMSKTNIFSVRIVHFTYI